jgi:hypothetical protein
MPGPFLLSEAIFWREMPNGQKKRWRAVKEKAGKVVI